MRVQALRFAAAALLGLLVLVAQRAHADGHEKRQGFTDTW